MRFLTAATAPLTEPLTAVAAEDIADGCGVFAALRAGLPVVLAVFVLCVVFAGWRPAVRRVLRDAAARAALRRLAAFAVALRVGRDRAAFFAAVLRRVAFFATVPPLPTVGLPGWSRACSYASLRTGMMQCGSCGLSPATSHRLRKARRLRT